MARWKSRFSDLPIRYKLFYSYTAFLLVILGITNLIAYLVIRQIVLRSINEELTRSTAATVRMVRSSIDLTIHNYLRAVAEKNHDLVQLFYDRVQDGEMTREQAEAEIRKLMLTQKIGDTGYIYVLNISDAPARIPLVIHPYIEGRDVADVSFVQQAVRIRNGYLEYRWKNPNQLEPLDKSMYLVEFSPWNWLIAVSSYHSEFLDLIRTQDLIREMVSMRFGTSGYPLVLNTQGYMVIHPTLSGRYLPDVDPLNAKLVRRVIEQKRGILRYRWKDPGSTRLRDKVMMLDYLPDLGWIVAASVYRDEYYRPLIAMRWIMLALPLLAMGLAVPLSLRIGSGITRPVMALIGHFKVGDSGIFSTRTEVTSRDEVGQLGNYFNLFMDRLENTHRELEAEILEHKATSLGLAESEKRFRNIIETAAEGFVEADARGRIVFVNSEVERMLDLTAEQIIGQTIYDLTDESGRNVFVTQMLQRRNGNRSVYENRVVNRHGRVYICLFNACPVLGPNQEFLGSFAMITDITERKRIEEENRMVRLYLSTVINSLGTGLIATDEAGSVRQCNKTILTLFELQPDSVEGKMVWDLIPCLEPMRDDILQAAKSDISMSFPAVCEVRGCTYHLAISVTPLTSDAGGAVILIDDVTEMKRKDEQLQQAQKMEMIGNLAGGLAHDFNNILTGITGSVSLMSFYKTQKSGTPTQYDSLIDILGNSAQRATQIVRRLLTLARKHPLDVAPFDLAKSVENTLLICRTTFDRSVDIRWLHPGHDCIVEGDAVQIEQVLLNLCINAYHAMTTMRPGHETPGGVLTLDLHRVEVDRHFRNAHIEAVDNAYWRISVIDSGVGIEPGNLRRIFDPFFSTKGRESGSGLGLSMVYSLIKQHHGFVDVYSQVGIGSTFNLYLPMNVDATTAGEEPEQRFELKQGEGMILVVDDEPVMQEVARSILMECGYEVVIAADGVEALELFTRNRDEIRGVLLDLSMPRLSGSETYLKLRDLDPGVRVLMASGHRQDPRIEQSLKAGVKDFIQKPFSLLELSHRIHDLVNPSEDRP